MILIIALISLFSLPTAANIALDFEAPEQALHFDNNGGMTIVGETQKVEDNLGPCEARGDVIKLNFHTNIGTPRYFHHLSSAEIEAKFKEAGGFVSRHDSAITPGITSAKMGTRLSTGVEILSNGKESCMHIKQIEFEIGFSELEVYINNSYPQKSCEYKNVFEHENEHVKIHQRSLKKHAKALAKALQQKAASIAPIPLLSMDKKTIDASLEEIENELKVISELYISKIEATAKISHEKLDSPESYKKTQRRCKNW